MPAAERADAVHVLTADRGIAAVMSAQLDHGGGLALIQAIPSSDPSSPAVGATIDRLRPTFPAARWSAARPPRTTTSRRRSHGPPRG